MANSSKYPFLSSSEKACMVAVHLAPRSSKDRVVGIHNARLKVAVSAPPVDGKANEALENFLAKLLGCSRRQVEVVSGHTSRQKVVAVSGVSVETVAAALDYLLRSD